MRTITGLALGLAAVLLSGPTAVAQQETSTAGGSGGGSRSQELGWVEFGAAVVPDLDGRLSWFGGTNTYTDDLNLEFDLGFAMAGGFREKFQSWLAVEFEAGLFYHSLDQATTPAGRVWTLDFDLYQVPIMLNVVFELPGEHRVTPFVGGGAGAMVSWLETGIRLPADDGTWLPVDESSVEAAFAYQAFAGLRLRTGDAGAISLTYRLVGGGSPTWGLEPAGLGGDVGSLKVEDIVVHALALGFHIEF
jgi:hypothetical protein